MQSSYKRDFTWPTYLSSKENKHAESLDLELTREENQSKDPCEKERRRVEKAELVTKIKEDIEEKFEAVPEYLIKLFQKYPHLHAFYQLAGEEQLMKKIEGEIYKTSYQIDFGKEGFIAKDDYDELIEVADALRRKRERVCKAEVHGPEGKRLGDNCTTTAEPCTCKEDVTEMVKMAMKPPSITKMPRIPREAKPKDGADKESFKGKGSAPDKTKNASEYKDSIDRLGMIIIKQRLHFKKLEAYI